ncbi:hypothetical protein ACW9I8_01520 [Pseudomonas reactans]
MSIKSDLTASSGFAIRCLWGCLIVVPSVWVLLEALNDSGALAHMDVPAWVQAIGSILAIIYAVRIADAQHAKNSERVRIEEVEQYQKLVGYVGFVKNGMSAAVMSLTSVEANVVDLKRYVALLQDSAEVLSQVGLDNVKNMELAITWIHFRHILFDFINEASKEDDLSSVIEFRLPHMQLSLERAEACEKEMLEMSDNI